MPFGWGGGKRRERVEAELAGLVAGHLRDGGFEAESEGASLATGIGGVGVRFKVKEIKEERGGVTLVYWALCFGIPELAGQPMELDLVATGDDEPGAVMQAAHAVVDGVLSIFAAEARGDLEGTEIQALPVTSVTGDDAAVTWDLLLGPPGIGGEPREPIESALANLVLFQGIMDALTPVLEHRTGHWLKLFLVRTASGELHGDVKVDGVPIGVPASFVDAPWGDVPDLIVRQFGVIRPSDRPADASLVEELERRRSEDG